MKKLSITPEKMAVVKKTITATIPGKTKGGVPRDPAEAMKFFDSELQRHDELAKKYHKLYYGNNTKVGSEENFKKLQDVVSNASFLRKQKEALQDKLEKAKSAKNIAAYRKKQAERPILEKVKDAVIKLGSTGGYAGG